MPLRNGEHGYGVVTKFLHWLTVAAIIGQFLVGWTMEADDEALDREKDRIDALEDAGKEQAKGQGDAAEDAFKDEIDRLEDELDAREDDYVSAAFSDVFSGDFLGDGLSLPEIHVLLGLSIMSSVWFGWCGGSAHRCRRGRPTSGPGNGGSSRCWRRCC